MYVGSVVLDRRDQKRTVINRFAVQSAAVGASTFKQVKMPARMLANEHPNEHRSPAERQKPTQHHLTVGTTTTGFNIYPQQTQDYYYNISPAANSTSSNEPCHGLFEVGGR
jgi:non-ribosomal peptide synthetase component E (peptide arylation enzyme)